MSSLRGFPVAVNRSVYPSSMGLIRSLLPFFRASSVHCSEILVAFSCSHITLHYYIPQRFTSDFRLCYVLNRATIFRRSPWDSSYRVRSILEPTGSRGREPGPGYGNGTDDCDHVRACPQSVQ